MSKKPTATDATSAIAGAATGQVKVALPAWVMEYDRVQQRAMVQIAIRYKVNGEPRARSACVNVPVQWLGVTWDLEPGEWGVALICDRAIDEWKQAGSTDITPQDPRRWDVSDAVFLPGVRPFADPLPSDAVASGAVVVWDRGTSDLRLGGSGATEWVALAQSVLARLNAIETAFNLHTHLYTPGALAAIQTGPSATAGSTVIADIAATKVKAE